MFLFVVYFHFFLMLPLINADSNILKLKIRLDYSYRSVNYSWLVLSFEEFIVII